MVYRVAQQNNYDDNDHLMIYKDEKDDFESLNKDFKLLYFSTFRSEDSGVFLNICQKMQEIDDKFNLKVFKNISRTSSLQPRWTVEFIKNELDPYMKKIRKVFLCGPTSFLDDINSMLKEVNIGKEKIHFV